jgi:alanine-synthesizing transaminase
VQVAAPELLERGAVVREQIARRISTNYQGLLDKTISSPTCRLLPAGGGWSAVLEVPSLESEEALVVNLLQNAGVLAHPGYFFDFPRESYLVVSLLVSERPFADGTDRVLRHFDCAVRSHE